MGTRILHDAWADGDAYEAFMGRWSRAAAERFVSWLRQPPGLRWLDVGCGTGALSDVVLRHADPRELVGIDRSEAYVETARGRSGDPRARFDTGDAQALPAGDAGFDVAVSGLVLNFVPEPEGMLREMARAVRPGGSVAVYVWDYADGMELLRRFWDAAVALDPEASELDEGRRFGICRPEALEQAFADTGLAGVEISSVEVPTRFGSFEEYWNPFFGGQGPAPGYARALGDAPRARLRRRLEADLASGPDGAIELRARAWAARGVRAEG